VLQVLRQSLDLTERVGLTQVIQHRIDQPQRASVRFRRGLSDSDFQNNVILAPGRNGREGKQLTQPIEH
jgi:hypothetical protein